MNITELKGIGAKTAENFNRLSVYTVSDLVGLYPRDYDVYHEPVFVKDISHESEHTEVAVEGQVYIPFQDLCYTFQVPAQPP